MIFPFCPCPTLLVPAHKLLLVHHLSHEGHGIGGIIGVRGLELGNVDGADVAGTEAAGEEGVGGEDEAGGGVRGSDPMDGRLAGVRGGHVGFCSGGWREGETSEVGGNGVMAVEVKLRGWRSSARSSSHGDGDGSIVLLGRERVRV